jgi:hypothetical protein
MAMTPARTRANGFGTPSLPQLLLTALLRMLAELVLHVASTLQMCFRRPVVIGTRPMPDALPGEKSDSQQQELDTVAASDNCSITLFLRDREATVSKDGGVLTIQATPTGSFSGLSRESRLARHRDHLLIVPRPTLRVERGDNSL